VKQILVYGSREFGQVVRDLAGQCGFHFVGFIDDIDRGPGILGAWQEVSRGHDPALHSVAMAIGYGHLRERRNHWLTLSPPNPQEEAAVNSRAVLDKRIEQCLKERGLVPNILQVQFAERGDLRLQRRRRGLLHRRGRDDRRSSHGALGQFRQGGRGLCRPSGMRLILAILPTMLLVVYGQLVIKWRVAALSGLANPADGPLGRLVSYLGDPYILSAYVAALASSMTWMFVVESYPLSLAFPLHIGLTVMAVVVGGIYLFGEPITASRIVAVCLILAGIAIGSRS